MRPNGLILAALRDPASLPDWNLHEWDLLLRQLRHANLTASLHAQLLALGLLSRIPAQPRRHLDWSAKLASRHTQSVLWEVEFIRQAMSEAGVPLILLKGAAYVMAALPHSRGRIFSDIDIIVPKENLDLVESTLMLYGWNATHHDGYDQRYYRTWMHELPPMQHLTRATAIDVHHAILPVTARLHPDSTKLLAAAVPANGDLTTLVFAPIDMVLHSAVHLFHDGEYDQGLRDLVDIHSLLVHFSAEPGFWTSLTTRAQELELVRPLFYALRYAARLLHTPIPLQVMQAADSGRPNSVLLALMDSLFERALMPKHASCNDRYTGVARFALYLRANWLRMPLLLLTRHLLHKAILSPRKKEE
ncbi:nucleotidyltransferase domain-containing protein [Solimicrobium silvestre]|uniref:Nucleotidyltransferase n=1 Tax=Solimicrobium silvestre TaxID=2099400 RepID=A0A2S9GTA6_9BURK|nr:nucleotidyltransferase family protein [Solimicrobium silvestre]PRC90945.1 hypothetical protein S2091_4346 [Solimicrobium silvestre]